MDEKVHEVLPVVVEKKMIEPLGSIQDLLGMLQAYEKLKAKIVRPEDVQKIQGKDFLKKSYWRRLSKCFGISLHLNKEWETVHDDGSKTFYAVYTAIAPNGQSCEGDGACSTNEKGLEKTDHNTRATAHTRAKNRAISDLVGGGEVSAEEIIAENDKPVTEQPKDVIHITPAQAKRMFAIAKSKDYTNDEIKTHLKMNYNVDSSSKVRREWYEQICEEFKSEKALHAEVEE